MTTNHRIGPRAPSTLGESVRGITRTLAIPNGFTLSIAGVFGAVVGRYGHSGLLTPSLFVLGASLGFSLVAVVSRAHRDVANRPLSIVGIALLNVMPIAIVPAASALAYCFDDPDIAYPVGGFAACALYIIGYSVFVTAVSRRGV